MTLEPYFQLPDYIALRFNLRITHVYRGLLLGTGPLIDPGFRGRLSLPLHNLTTNKYRLTGGEGLIWVEFTKLSPASGTAAAARGGESHPEAPERHGQIVRNPRFEQKKDNEVEDYLRKADPYRPIRSSIPAATADAEAAAKDARNTTIAFRRVATLAALAALVGIASLVVAMLALLNDVNARVDGLEQAEDKVAELEQQVEDLTERLEQAVPAPPAPAPPSPSPTS